MKFAKYQALGNSYIVLNPAEVGQRLDPRTIRRICSAHHGVGSDGILLGPLPSAVADFGLRIFNPDGSEAQISGNGLRIFARALIDSRHSQRRTLTVETPAGVCRCEIHDDDRTVTAELGQVRFESAEIAETLTIDDQIVRFCAVSVGNPHCVVLGERPSPELARRMGPLIETATRFPQRTNVQFMRVMDRRLVRIEIWERGAGYTLASGSSAAAAAAVAHRLGLCDVDITVQMPGGALCVELSDSFFARITGPVVKTCDGRLAAAMFAEDQS